MNEPWFKARHRLYKVLDRFLASHAAAIMLALYFLCVLALVVHAIAKAMQ